MAECSECGENLGVNPVDDLHHDFIDIICRECGNIENNVSLVREKVNACK